MPRLLTRRHVLQGLAAGIAAPALLGGYAFAIEPYRLRFPRYALTPRGWPEGLRLRIAAIADPHICEPWMPLGRVREIVAETNAQEPDLIVLLGDYVTHHRFVRETVPHDAWAVVLADLKAPLGVHAILGNHDWWEDLDVQRRKAGPTPSGIAMRRAGISVYENDAVRLRKGKHAFWIAGLGDQWAFYQGRWIGGRHRYTGVDDVPGTLAMMTDDAPAILMAHEPDVFAVLSDRFALTLSGHTHGGQVQFLGYAPIVPSRFGRRYAYGHIQEGERHLIVSGGLGCSGVPIRFGRPPEVPIIEIGASA